MKKLFVIFTSSLFIISCGGGDSSANTNEADKKTTDETKATAPAAEVKDPEAEKGLSLVAKSDCLTCHKLTEPLVGPAYAAVAAKYKGQENMVDSLAHKIIKGGSGVWGEVPMTPHPQISEDEARSMVHYVMSIK